MKRLFSILFVTSLVISSVFSDQLKCKDPNGNPVDWFMAIKIPKLWSNLSDGTVYVYMDNKDPVWKYLTGITTTESAIGHTITQMYASSENYNNSIMWLVYNDEPTNAHTTLTLGHTKGIVVADKSTGFWLVHSVPKFPQLPYQNNNTYTYPKTGVLYGQSFLCVSMVAEELDKVGDQLINNEVLAYGSHFGKNLIQTYPSLYNASLSHDVPRKENNGVKVQNIVSQDNVKFISISKNRHFGKDLYEDFITHLAQSNLYAETWLNTKDRFNSSCDLHYKTMNIKSLIMEDIKGLNKSFTYKSLRDHSKWVITDNVKIPWICIGDLNRGLKQTHRGGGTVCIDSNAAWKQFKKLVSDIDSCKK